MIFMSNYEYEFLRRGETRDSVLYFLFRGVAKLGHLPSKRKGGHFTLICQKMEKISIINPTYLYVYECVVKIEDENKKFNQPTK